MATASWTSPNDVVKCPCQNSVSFLLERRRRPGHPIEPPARERDHGAGVGPVDLLVGGAELRAVLRPGPGPAQFPDHVLHPRFGGADLAVLHHGFGSRGEREDGVDGPIGTGLDRLRDLGGEGPEPRAPQQVRGLRHIPAVLGRRRERLEASWHNGPPLTSDVTTPASHSKRVAHLAKRAAVRKSSRETTRPGLPPGLGSLTAFEVGRARQVPRCPPCRASGPAPCAVRACWSARGSSWHAWPPLQSSPGAAIAAP